MHCVCLVLLCWCIAGSCWIVCTPEQRREIAKEFSSATEDSAFEEHQRGLIEWRKNNRNYNNFRRNPYIEYDQYSACDAEAEAIRTSAESRVRRGTNEQMDTQ